MVDGAEAADLGPLFSTFAISLDRKPDEYADGIAKQMLGDETPAFFEWCHVRDLDRISKALTYQQNRTGASTK
ncbi:MAG: hypothetical protein Q7K57_37290 [Burkholderiaceae bacterium]|nr:hypothetical protein [Burkholderiaceae bacterium]